MQQFPTTIDRFSAFFSDEQRCIRFLFNTRWPHGFTCSYCNWVNTQQPPSKTITCGHCGHPTSITTDTVMHGTKKPLHQWLLCIWWFIHAAYEHSAKDLQRFLHLKSYQTAWAWLQKLRMAMAIADNKQLCGTVEISTNTIAVNGKDTARITIIAGAEIILPMGITGRIKMQVVPEQNAITPSLAKFVKTHIEYGSSLILPPHGTDNFTLHDFVTVTSSSTEISNEIIKSFAIWLHKIHRGGVAVKHLQLYLDEFCFRSNGAMLPDEEALFKLLISGVLSKKPTSYKAIISKTSKE